MSKFKPKMHQIRLRLGLRSRPRWGSLQRSPRPPNWNYRLALPHPSFWNETVLPISL